MVNCGEPGCRHDSRVFRQSRFHTDVEANRFDYFPQGSYILGDSAYRGFSPAWLIYPFIDNGRLTVNQNIFNTRMSKVRVVVEHAFGILKGRFQRLLYQFSFFDIPFIVDTVVACCVLHNICISAGDDGEDFRVGDPDVGVPEPVNGEGEVGAEEGFGGLDARSRLFGEMFAL